MASCLFLLRQFDDVLVYLRSIKSYFYNDDSFNFNYAQTLVRPSWAHFLRPKLLTSTRQAASGNFKEAEEVFLLVQSDKMRQEYAYLSWLARSCT
jgi:intraflagellar transport protein 56